MRISSVIFLICVRRSKKLFFSYFSYNNKAAKVLKPPAHLIYSPSRKFPSYEPIILSVSRKENLVLAWIQTKEYKIRSFFRVAQLFITHWPKNLAERWQHCTGHCGQKAKARALFNGGGGQLLCGPLKFKKFIFKAGYVINIFSRFNGAIQQDKVLLPFHSQLDTVRHVTGMVRIT